MQVRVEHEEALHAAYIEGLLHEVVHGAYQEAQHEESLAKERKSRAEALEREKAGHLQALALETGRFTR